MPPQAGARLLPRFAGRIFTADDVALFADGDLVSAWYRLAAQGRSDIIVRRMRITD